MYYTFKKPTSAYRVTTSCILGVQYIKANQNLLTIAVGLLLAKLILKYLRVNCINHLCGLSILQFSSLLFSKCKNSLSDKSFVRIQTLTKTIYKRFRLFNCINRLCENYIRTKLRFSTWTMLAFRIDRDDKCNMTKPQDGLFN